MLKPNTKRRSPATILPSENLVIAPRIQEVTGMIARIRTYDITESEIIAFTFCHINSSHIVFLGVILR